MYEDRNFASAREAANCEAKRVLGAGYCINSFHEEGYWSANAATADRCVGVYGFERESEALQALAESLRQLKSRKAG